MNRKSTIHTASTADLNRIAGICDTSSLAGAGISHLKSMIESRTLLKSTYQDQPEGVVGLDLSRGTISGPWIRKDLDFEDRGVQLLVAAERLAVQFGMTQLTVCPTEKTTRFFADNGYGKAAGRKTDSAMSRSIKRRTTRFGRMVREMGEDLGIPADYGVRHKLRLQKEAKTLRSIGKDIFERTQKMTPDAASAWKRMVRQAQSDGVIIQPVSAFRAVSYQANLVRKKLQRGQSMAEILAVSAAPGYSEHHTGCAIDVTTPGFEVLEEEFEKSPAFEWLCNHAAEFHFNLSYPRKNVHNIAYEPWHWCWQG